MTQEEFIAVLKKKRYSYETKGDKIVITHRGNVVLNNLETLPPGVAFENDGGVWLRSLKTLPPGVEFKNKGWVDLSSLKALPPGVEFQNGGDVYIKELGWVEDNKGIRIEGADSNRLLNLMISKGLFI